jgi:hypothetical protein
MSHTTQTPTPTPTEIRPWYREPWPWFLIILLSTVVVAGFITAWLAFNGADPLIISDREYQAVRAELKASPAPDTPPQGSDQDDDD